MFITRAIIRNMMLSVERGIETQRFAMLWLASYVFLLRVPSEALPMCRGEPGSVADEQSVIFLESPDTVCLKLKSRKNKIGGSVLKRKCCCKACSATCPVHALWHNFFEKMEVGARPWADVSPNEARGHLRFTLQALGVSAASSVVARLASCGLLVKVSFPELYGTHDFRRGHAKVWPSVSRCACAHLCGHRTCRTPVHRWP